MTVPFPCDKQGSHLATVQQASYGTRWLERGWTVGQAAPLHPPYPCRTLERSGRAIPKNTRHSGRRMSQDQVAGRQSLDLSGCVPEVIPSLVPLPQTGRVTVSDPQHEAAGGGLLPAKSLMLLAPGHVVP